MIDIVEIMTGLSRVRPIFHSEADFQHALAWHIHQVVPNCGVRLEYRRCQEEAMYLDLWLSGIGVALELKYVTRELEHVEKGEVFSLRNQSAQDTRRYDFLRDIQRLERISGRPDVRGGYAIMVTNDAAYWKVPAREPETNDARFRLHEGLKISGQMEWSKRAGSGTTKGRQAPIQLDRSYDLGWRDYSAVERGRNQQFRYLLVHVSG